MRLVNRPVADEPDEKPTQIGRALWQIACDAPGEWRVAFEGTSEAERRQLTTIEGCIIGRGKGRIAGIGPISQWEARLVQHVEDEGSRWELRVRYTPPAKIGVPKVPEQMERLRQGHQVTEGEHETLL